MAQGASPSLAILFTPSANQDLLKFHYPATHSRQPSLHTMESFLAFPAKSPLQPPKPESNAYWISHTRSLSVSTSSSQESQSGSESPVKAVKKTHLCGICHKTFERPSTLKTHMNSHTGLKPYKCLNLNCTRRFSVRSNMRRHHLKCVDSSVAGSPFGDE